LYILYLYMDRPFSTILLACAKIFGKVYFRINVVKSRGGEISKIYTCPRTTGRKKALVRTKALLARTQINTKAKFVNIMI